MKLISCFKPTISSFKYVQFRLKRTYYSFSYKTLKKKQTFFSRIVNHQLEYYQKNSTENSGYLIYILDKKNN